MRKTLFVTHFRRFHRRFPVRLSIGWHRREAQIFLVGENADEFGTKSFTYAFIIRLIIRILNVLLFESNVETAICYCRRRKEEESARAKAFRLDRALSVISFVCCACPLFCSLLKHGRSLIKERQLLA